MLRVRLGALAELPIDDLRAFTVAGVTWPVMAGVIAGEVVATAGVCPHEDVGLDGGEVADGCLTCAPAPAATIGRSRCAATGPG